MNCFTSQQQQVLNDFIEQTRSLIHMGFAHTMVNDIYRKKLDCLNKNLQTLKSVKKINPTLHNCYDQLLRREYIRYITQLIRAGLNYVKNNPEYMDTIVRVQNVLNDYEKLTKNSKFQMPSSAYFKDVSGRNEESQHAAKMSYVNGTFKNPNPVNEILQNPNQVRENQNSAWKNPNPRARTYPARQSPSTDDNNAFEEIFENMSSLNKKIDEAKHRTYNLDKNYSTPKSFRRSSDCLERFDKEISRKLFEIQSAKKNRMRQHEKAKKFEQTMPKRNLNNYFDPVIRNEDGDFEDSFEEYQSEILINDETFIKPQPQQPPRIGRIERNIVIPIQVEENQRYPKIKPYAYFEEAQDGSMRINVRLEFDEKVLCNDKLVNQVKVRNLLTM